MSGSLRLLCVLAHPDDESLGMGGTLAMYASEGVETYLVTATRGERGRFGNAVARPGPEVVGKVRESELLAAANELGLKDVEGGAGGAHRVSKLYYMAWTREKWAAHQAAFRTVKIQVDGQERQATPWPDWAITTVIDTRARVGPVRGSEGRQEHFT